MLIAPRQKTGRPIRLKLRPALRGAPSRRQRHIHIPAGLRKEALRAQTLWLTETRFRVSARAIVASLSINAVVALAALRGVAPTEIGTPPSPEVVLIRPTALPPELLNPPKLDAIPRAPLARSARTELRLAPQPLASPPAPPAPDWLSAASSPAVLEIAAAPGRPREALPVADGGTTGGTPAVEAGFDASYWQDVRNRVAAEVRYPLSARRRAATGEVTLCVAVDARGGLIVAKPVASSADEDLIAAAVSAARRAAPFPPPRMAPGAGTNLVVALFPIKFEVVEKENQKKGAKE